MKKLCRLIGTSLEDLPDYLGRSPAFRQHQISNKKAAQSGKAIEQLLSCHVEQTQINIVTTSIEKPLKNAYSVLWYVRKKSPI